jgi:hypothetical protein
MSIAAFVVFSRIVTGVWFADDFFVPENTAKGHPYDALAEIAWGVRTLSGSALLVVALAGAALLAGWGLFSKRRLTAMVPIALAATAAVPWLAFIDGHPYRIRYMVPLLAAEAVFAGFLAGAWKRLQPLLVGLVLGASADWGGMLRRAIAAETEPVGRPAPLAIA